MNLSEAKAELQRGVKLCGSLSYQRRPPTAESRLVLQSVRSSLEDIAITNSGDPEVWRMLSLAEECLLNYGAAIAYLGRSVSISKSKKDLMRLHKLKATHERRGKIPLNDQQLHDLQRFVMGKLPQANSKRDFTITLSWLRAQNIEEIAVIESFRNYGVYSDFQVIYGLAL